MSTSADLIAMLHASLNPPSKPVPGYLVSELQDPTGVRRADALYFPMGHGVRGHIVGYEIKVSRADLLVELKDPMKADPWLRYCNRWWLFVSDPSFAAGLDIPEVWGIMAPPAKGRALTIIRPAPLLRPVNQAPAYLAAIARLFYADGAVEHRLVKQLSNHHKTEEKLRASESTIRNLTQQLAAVDPSSRNPDREIIDEVLRLLRADWNNHGALEKLGAKRIAELLGDIATLDEVARTLANKDLADLRQLEQVHEQRGRALKIARKQITDRLKPANQEAQ